MNDDDAQLFFAIRQNYFEQVCRLLEQGISPNARDEYGKPVLQEAISCRKNKIAHLLLDNGADPNAAYHNPFAIGNIGAVVGPLHVAANVGDLEMVTVLVERGANIHGVEGQSETPLHFAMAGFGSGIVEYLLEHGADPNATDCSGYTPLLLGAARGLFGEAKNLLKFGAAVDAQNVKGWTSLHFAAEKGLDYAVKLLLEAGANPNIVTDEGWTPLILALWYAWLTNSKCTELLVEAGADVNYKGVDWKTPLAVAVMIQDADAIRYLLGKGAKVENLSPRDEKVVHDVIRDMELENILREQNLNE